MPIHTIPQGKSRAAAFLYPNQASSHTCAVRVVQGVERRGNFSAETVTETLPVTLLRGKGFSCLLHLELAVDSATKFCFSDHKGHYNELFGQTSSRMYSEA